MPLTPDHNIRLGEEICALLLEDRRELWQVCEKSTWECFQTYCEADIIPFKELEDGVWAHAYLGEPLTAVKQWDSIAAHYLRDVVHMYCHIQKKHFSKMHLDPTDPIEGTLHIQDFQIYVNGTRAFLIPKRIESIQWNSTKPKQHKVDTFWPRIWKIFRHWPKQFKCVFMPAYPLRFLKELKHLCSQTQKQMSFQRRRSRGQVCSGQCVKC